MIQTKYSSVVHKAAEYESNEEIAKQYKKYQSSPKFNLNSEEIFCICRRPDLGGELMIGCDGCNEWYHFKCMKINLLYKDLISKFYCKFCQWKGKGVSVWKRKCLVDDCWNPISIEEGKNSKYCSKECGIKYFQTMMAGNSQVDKINSLLNHCGNQEEFNQLGNKFPEFLKLENIHQDSDQFNQLPVDIRDKLTTISTSTTRLEQEIVTVSTKLELLTKYKESMKLLNDKLSGTGASEEGKSKGKSKAKRIELCLCNKQLRQVDQNILDEFNNNMDNIIDAYKIEQATYNDICLTERRKCPRHNGWFNLVQDEYVRTAAQNEAKLNELIRSKKLLVRDYSISVYENKENNAP